MNYAQQTPEWQSTMTHRKSRYFDRRRRQEEDIDDQPMMPVRTSSIVEMEEDVLPPTELYPTLSNLQRNGAVAVGRPLNHSTNDDSTSTDDDYNNRYQVSSQQLKTTGLSEYEDEQQMYHQLPSPPQVRRRRVSGGIPPDANIILPPINNSNDNRGSVATSNRRPRPHTVTVPQRGVRRCLSAVTMSSDLFSFDGSEFEAIPAADDYMDDDQLQEYLDQLAKEEDRKNKERESLKKELFSASGAANNRERESLRQLLLQQLDGEGRASNEDYEAYLDRFMEEQIQAEEQCKSKVARRVSDISL